MIPIMLDIELPKVKKLEYVKYDFSRKIVSAKQHNAWSRDNKEDYDKRVDEIHSYRIENELFKLNCWVDISGFDYWSTQDEKNYFAVIAHLKKCFLECNQAEIKLIQYEINKAYTKLN
jgi:hypothetical protein